MKLLGNSAFRRYWGSGLLTSIAALLLFGCSSTPDAQTLQRSLGKNASQITAPPAPPASDISGFVNRPIDDEVSQIKTPNGRYILGSGDVITVTVWGHPELSGKRVIGPDGEIQLPFVGSFRIAGLTADDSGRKITSALSEDYLNTAASVTVDSYNSNQITVLGHVAHPGVLTFAGDPTLLEALAQAGASPSKDDQGGMPTRCAIIRGRDKIMWVDLRPLLKGTNVSLNIPL